MSKKKINDLDGKLSDVDHDSDIDEILRDMSHAILLLNYQEEELWDNREDIAGTRRELEEANSDIKNAMSGLRER